MQPARVRASLVVPERGGGNMNENDKIQYHRDRASEELALAMAAACDLAAEAHYRLSGLHLMTARALSPSSLGSAQTVSNVLAFAR